ncbi:MAG: hypothetical protein AMXMBFR7_47690 [Planctomycetota bacterium]
MEFLTGTMLWGLLAGGLPILIHLTGRAKPVVHRFPALRFIVASQRSSSRALRIKHLLLLLLRVAAIALLALALARPMFPWFAGAGLAGLARGEYVLVLDASLSMQFKDQNTTRFERAREQAMEFVGRLAPESRVALLLATEDVEYRQARLTLDHLHVRDLLERSEPTARGLDLAAALQAARRVFDREPAGVLSRSIVFFTDLQAENWVRLSERSITLDDPAAAPVLIVADVGEADARNGAVTALSIPGPTVAAQETLTLTALLRPVDPQRAAPLDLYLDGVKVAQQSVDPKGAAEVPVSFNLPAGAPGPHSVALTLAQGDGLLSDQTRTATYLAGRPPRALLVEQPSRGEGDRGSGFFLKAALSSAAATSASGLAVSPIAARELNADALAPCQVAILADCGPLGEPAWEALEAFVAEGGGLFVWAGARMDLAELRRHGYAEFAPHRGLLPGRPLERERPPAPQGVRPIASDHPLLARFTPGVLSALRGLKVNEFIKVVPELKDTLSVPVLAYDDGSPMVLEKGYGRGRVLLCTLAPDAEASDLPKTGEVFVTFALEAARLLSGRGEEAQARLGRALALPLPEPPADGRVRWKPPGEAAEITLNAETEKREGAPPRARVHLPKLEQPGVHRIAWKPAQAGAESVRLVAVNPAPEESDLASMDAKSALARLKPWPAQIVRDLSEAGTVLGEPAAGRELPVPLLLLVLALLFAESFLSNRLYRQTEGDES